jgi:hypothetical protein
MGRFPYLVTLMCSPTHMGKRSKLGCSAYPTEVEELSSFSNRWPYILNGYSPPLRAKSGTADQAEASNAPTLGVPTSSPIIFLKCH